MITKKTEKQMALEDIRREKKDAFNKEMQKLDEAYANEELQAQTEQCANALYSMQKSLEDAGFTEQQAFELVSEIVKGQLK